MEGGQLPVFDLPQPGASFARPARCEYGPSLEGRPLVIDNGSHTVKAGWAGEDAPRVVFRSQVTKVRNRGGGTQRVCVGDWGTGVKGWEFSKGAIRTPFEEGVVVNYEGQEALLDYAFDRLGVTGGRVDHPLAVTEPPLNPSAGRAAMAELAFETYGVPALHFVDPGAAAFAMHRAGGSLGTSGIAVSIGHSSTTLVPIINGNPAWHAAIRSAVGGAVLTDQMQQLLRLRYPGLLPGLLSESVAEALKEKHCRAAGSYPEVLAAVAAAPETAGGHGVAIRLPRRGPVGPTPEEIAQIEARKAARLEEARRRGKEQAKLRREKLLGEKEEYLKYMLALKDEVEAAGEDQESVKEMLAGGQFRSVAELDKYIGDARSQIDRTRAQIAAAAAAEAAAAGEGGTPGPGEGTAADDHQQQQQQQQKEAGGSEPPGGGGEGDANPYPLLGVPDAELDEEGRKEKRRQAAARASSEARARAAARREERARAAAARLAEEDAAMAADPGAYIAGLRQRYAAAAARAEARRRRRLGLPAEAGGRRAAGSRGDAGQRARMRLLAQAAGVERKRRGGSSAAARGGGTSKRGRGDDSEDDGFGADDADWDVYKQMHPEQSDSEAEAAEEEELQWLTDRLQAVGAAADEAAAAAAAAGGADAVPAGWPDAAGGDGGWGDTSGGAFAPLLPALRTRAPLLPGVATTAAAGPAATALPAASGAGGGRSVAPSLTPPPALPGRGATPEAAARRSATPEAPGGPTTVGAMAAAGANEDTLLLGLELFRVPEVLFQPSLAGVDEAGLPELVQWCLRRVTAEERAACIAGGLLLLGGGAAFPGMAPRLEAELTARLPYGSPMRVVVGNTPALDAWRGAAHICAAGGAFGGSGGGGGGGGSGAREDWGGALTREAYEEYGPEIVKSYGGPAYR